MKKKTANIRLTSQDLLDVILLDCDEDVKTLLLERYSAIYPIPLVISQYHSKQTQLFYHLAYFVQPYKTMISFGLLKASWTQCGKSALIDELFSTDFTSNYRGNYDARVGASGGSMQANMARSKYDIGRINIQFPRNIDSYEDETQWSIIDVTRFYDPSIVDFICWKVNMICAHILASDMLMSFQEINEIIKRLKNYQKRIIVFIRDIDELS